MQASVSAGSLAMDLICLVVIALCATYYARKGFVAGIFSFFGTFIAMVLAALAAYNLAPALFNSLFRPGLEQQMTEMIADQGVRSVNELLRSALGFLPPAVVDSVAGAMNTQLDFAAPDISVLVVDQVFAPLVTPLITIIVFFLAFSLLRILIGVIRGLATGLARVPAMSTVNGALGAAVGVFIAALYIFLALCVIWAYDAVNPAQALGEQYFANSLVYRALSGLNFFAKI